MMNKSILSILFLFLLTVSSGTLKAEDGSRLWLRFSAKEMVALPPISAVKGPRSSVALSEFLHAWKEMSGKAIIQTEKIENNVLLLGTSRDKDIRKLALDDQLKALGDEGYVIKAVSLGDRKITVVASESEIGLLYGVFHLLRLIQTEELPDNPDISEKPLYDLRLLNHWDNLDGTVERGYAGYSIWKWNELPAVISPRYKEYARANASIGINGTVLNNVNASPQIISSEYLRKVKAVADVLRPYGVKVFLSVNFSSPKILGGLSNSDPLNPLVQQWWSTKTAEIYRLIPDFGGFLVKANSEGQPGPHDYGRTHADGANMLGDVLKPHGGVVMWRAFVYSPSGDDRARQAYGEFMPLDGQFRDNVIIQVKNGPVDFQPREPFSPLFGAMRRTALMPEVQITQEYLGFSNHLVFLAPQWKEFLDSDTYRNGDGSTVAQVTDGTSFKHPISAIAGVANIGQDANWCGHHFAQSNWYAFGRLAWNHELTAEQIANEWLRLTFTNNKSFVDPVKQMMLTSWQTAVDYMMPLGLHHIFAWDHHYGPEPWCEIDGARPDWLPRYYHKADEEGIGFDRTVNGSNAVSDYAAPLKNRFKNIETCPEELLLWFHHVSWSYSMKNGRTLWDELCYRYDSGVRQVRCFQKVWDKTEPFVDHERFRHVQSKLKIQSRDAVWWKDACLLYFQTFSRRPIPYDIERPVYELEDLMKIKLDLKHHN